MLDEVGVGGTGEGEEEEEVESWGTFEEKRREALKRGNPVCCLHRRQKAILVLKNCTARKRKIFSSVEQQNSLKRCLWS